MERRMDMAKKVLVVDDEKLIVKGIRFSLEQDGMDVDCAYDGQEAIDLATNNKYDIILLDVMLPIHDGFEVCQHIREFSDVPIIMLTAKGDDMDKILGLEYGADDYITKPFNILEVKARIKAIIRRSASKEQPEVQKTYSYNGLSIDLDSRRGYINDEEVNLTAKEFDILRLLLENPQRVYTKAQIYSLIWNDAYMGDENAVNVHISRLRTKIEDDPRKPQVVITVWGIGYKLGEQK